MTEIQFILDQLLCHLFKYDFELLEVVYVMKYKLKNRLSPRREDNDLPPLYHSKFLNRFLKVALF